LLNVLGKDQEALDAVDKAIKLEPTSTNKRMRGMILYFSRRYEEAISQLLEGDQSDPDDLKVRAKWISASYEMKGDYANAVEYSIRHVEAIKKGQSAGEAIRSAFAKAGWPGVLKYRISLLPDAAAA